MAMAQTQHTVGRLCNAVAVCYQQHRRALLPGQAEFLATLYSFGAMLSFTIAHAAVIWLRKRHPEAELGGVSWTLDALGI